MDRLKILLTLTLFIALVNPAAALDHFIVDYQGNSYRLPTKGWKFQVMGDSGAKAVQDMDVAVKLAQARDSLKQFLAPDVVQYAELATSLEKLMGSVRNKHTLNQFDQALSNVAGSFIGSSLRTVMFDVSGGASFASALVKAANVNTGAIDLVTGSMATAAAAGYLMTSSEALGVGLYFGRMSELSARQVADFQSKFFSQGRQTQIIPLAELQAVSNSAHQALRLAYPAAVLMNETTHRTGWDTLKSFVRNTIYGAIPYGLGDGMSMIDSMVGATKEGIYSIRALKAFDQAINQGRGNPFETDADIYRQALRKYAGFVRESTLAKVLVDPVTGMEFILVKGGCFRMGDIWGNGDLNERPVHKVCVDDFYMAKHEVTFAQYKEIMGKYMVVGESDVPFVPINWLEAQDYIRRLNLKSGRNYRLPTEAEWEYACRSGGKEERYCGGGHNSGSGKKLYPVEQKQPNGLGLYGMADNANEWVSDWYGNDYYSKSPTNNPQGPLSGYSRIIRGVLPRSSFRLPMAPEIRGSCDGFRMAMTPAN